MSAKTVKRLNSEQNKLVEQYMDYAQAIALKYYHTRKIDSCSLEDLESVAYCALCEAAIKYDQSISSFRTYSFRRLWGALLDHARKNSSVNYQYYKNENSSQGSKKNESKHKQYFEELGYIVHHVSDKGHIECEYFGYSPEDLVIQKQFDEFIWKHVAELENKQQKIVSDYYCGELSMEKIGNIHGFSKSTTSREHRRAINSLRDLFDMFCEEQLLAA